MSIIGIIALARNYAIGKDGKLPWHYSSDLRFFKRTTTGNAVVMGITTWNSIGKPLPDRLNIVLSTRSAIDTQPGVLLLRSAKDVLALSEYLGCDVFIIGGAKTYENFGSVIERWIVTRVPETVEDADTFIPADLLEGFDVCATEVLEPGLVVEFMKRK